MLTELQRDAIARAQTGNFDLLDAMELGHRIDTGQCRVGFRHGGRLRFLGLADDGDIECPECELGRVPCDICDSAGFLECDDCTGRGTVTCLECDGDGCDACDEGVVKCEECAGAGQRDCEDCHGDGDVDCEICQGEGTLDFDFIDHGRRIVNLDGDVVFDDARDDPGTSPAAYCDTLTNKWVRKVMADYESEKHAPREAAEAQAEAAKPPVHQH